MSVRLKSPLNTQVTKLFVRGPVVQAGDLLLTLDDSHVQNFLATLRERESSLRAHLEALSQEKVAERREHLKDAANAFNEEMELLNEYFVASKDAFEKQAVDFATYQQTLQDLLTAEESRLQSSVALSQLDADADIARRYIERALEFIQSEQEYAKRKTARLSIKAPVGGRIRLFVGEHTPVKRGFVLAEIS